MMHLVFLLEEPSMKSTLERIVPKVIPDDVTVQYFVFHGKTDLEKMMSAKISGWKNDGSTQFIVMRDQDREDCRQVKERLLRLIPHRQSENALVRIVCTELESWFFGDLTAVEAGLSSHGRVPKNLNRFCEREQFRVPDEIEDAKGHLRRITGGVYAPALAGEIAEHMVPERNRSTSFQVFLKGVARLVENKA